MNNPFDEINTRLTKIESLLIRKSSIIENTPQDKEVLLNRKETAQLLKISLTTLYYWTKKGKIPAYSIQNRIYYKRSEIEKALIKIN